MSDDPTIPDNLINNHSKSNYVVKVKIISIGEGEMLPKQENFYNTEAAKLGKTLRFKFLNFIV